MRLLFVEDEPDLREVLKKQLQGSGYSVDACGDGLEALDYLQLTAYDAVILDIMLPGVDGLSVLKKMRTAGDKTPVLLLTARGGDWPVIVGNYLITNERMAASTDCLLTAVKDYDLTEAERDVIRTFDCADVEFLTAARDAAEARYGSMDAFLSQALGVGEAEREILRARWLTE